MTTKPTIPITTALCPICKQPRAVYHDAKRAAYYTRHQNGARWCKMSSKKVE